MPPPRAAGRRANRSLSTASARLVGSRRRPRVILWSVEPTTAPCACGTCGADHLRAFRPGDPGDRPQILTPADALALVRPLLDGRDRERCVLLSVDAKHRVIAVDTVSIGTAAHTFMRPREIYRDALLRGASAVFLAHNHPSGDAEPSRDDRMITRRLASAGATLGVPLLDHLVVGDPGWTSLAQEGLV